MSTKSLIIGMAAMGVVALASCSKKETIATKEVVTNDSKIRQQLISSWYWIFIKRCLEIKICRQ